MQKKRKGCDWNVLGCKAVIFHLHAFRKTMVVSCDSEAHMSAHATWHSTKQGLDLWTDFFLNFTKMKKKTSRH